MKSATAFAPASVGNIGVGFDILGHTIQGPGDRATVRRIDAPTVRIAAIRNASVALPFEAERNTAGAALIALRAALALPFGFEIELDKGIAFGSGMGGSAASCVAALVAANALIDAPLSREELYPFALLGEAVASGGLHGDNVGAMLLGGLGGGFVPVDSLPEWVQPIAPISPVYWAMEGYQTAILEGGGVGDVLGPLAVLAAFTAAFAGIALWRFKLDAPKRTWG